MPFLTAQAPTAVQAASTLEKPCTETSGRTTCHPAAVNSFWACIQRVGSKQQEHHPTHHLRTQQQQLSLQLQRVLDRIQPNTGFCLSTCTQTEALARLLRECSNTVLQEAAVRVCGGGRGAGGCHGTKHNPGRQDLCRVSPFSALCIKCG